MTFLRVLMVVGLVAVGLDGSTAAAQTAAGVDVDAPVVAAPHVEGGTALYEIMARASADQPQDRFHVSLVFCDGAGACESVASVNDASADDKRTTQTWPDASRGVPTLTVALPAEAEGTLKAVWEIYTFYDRVWHPDWDFIHESAAVPIGPAGGRRDSGGGAGGDGGGAGGEDSGGEDDPGGPDVRGGGDDGPRIGIGAAGRGGVMVTIVCREACRMRGSLSVGRRGARRLGLRGAVIGRLDTRLRRAGRRRIGMRVSRGVRQRLRRSGRARIRLVARGRVTERSGGHASVRRELAVRL